MASTPSTCPCESVHMCVCVCVCVCVGEKHLFQMPEALQWSSGDSESQGGHLAKLKHTPPSHGQALSSHQHISEYNPDLCCVSSDLGLQ